MFLYELACSRCSRVRHYKSGIHFDNLDIPKCICGGNPSVKILSENADNEIVVTEEELMEQDYFAFGR